MSTPVDDMRLDTDDRNLLMANIAEGEVRGALATCETLAGYGDKNYALGSRMAVLRRLRDRLVELMP